MNRRFELDIIRALAFLMIFLFHFNMMAQSLSIQTSFPLFVRTASQSHGELGVGLFLALSGIVLVNSFERSGQKLSTFYKKRFFAIFPLFYACYFITYLWIDLPTGNLLSRHMIWTLFGFDGFLQIRGVTTCYRVGEWYIGVILIYYVLFPFLYKLIKKAPLIFGACLLVFYAIFIPFYPFSFHQGASVLCRLPEFVLGIYFAMYMKKVDLLPAAIGGLVFLLLSFIEYPGYMMHGNLICIAGVFVCLYKLCSLVPVPKDDRRFHPLFFVVNTISKYSFSMFLFHHVVQEQLLKPRRGVELSILKYGVYMVFCFVITFILSVITQNGTEVLVKNIRKWFSSKFSKETTDQDQTSINT